MLPFPSLSDLNGFSFLLGFLCPVHTPDGAPCGLLNHMAASCQVNRGAYATAFLSNRLFTSLGSGLVETLG